MLHDPAERTSLPPSFVPSPLSEIVVLSDLWAPIGEVRSTIAQLSATGAHGHIIQIVDPAEESFPYSGRSNSLSRKAPAASLPAVLRPGGMTIKPSLGVIAPQSAPKLICAAGVLPSIAPTGRRASSCWCCIRAWATTRNRSSSTAGTRRRTQRARHDRLMATWLCQPLVLLGLLSLPVLWWLLRLVPPRPRRVDFPPTRLLFEIAPEEETPARTPWWLTLLRLTLRPW